MTRRLARSLLWLADTRQLAVNPGFRAEVFTRLRFGQRSFQRSAYTRDDRYPALFAYAQQQLKDAPARLLSFGCATGEEVFTLARYLPNAHIIGVDINPWCLAQCRRNPHPNLHFEHADSADFAALEHCDAIFALAVFQRTANFTGEPIRKTGFRFEHFAEAIAMLDRKLKPGGLLFLDHCDFSFADTPTAAAYQPADFPENVCLRKRPLFGPDNRRQAAVTQLPRAFRKDC